MNSSPMTKTDLEVLIQLSLQRLEELRKMQFALEANDSEAVQRFDLSLRTLMAGQVEMLQQAASNLASDAQKESQIRSVLDRLRPSRASVG
jgi:hypothetical protein